MTNTTHHEKRIAELLQGGFHEQVMTFYDHCIRDMGQELSILDLGAGSGLVSISLAEKGYTGSIVAYDRDLDCMRQLPAHPKIVKKAGDNVSVLPFSPQAFDVVICRYAFHHFDNKHGVLKEISRVLKQDGIFLYSDSVLPEHSKNILKPLYYLREYHFHGYLGYFETLELLEKAGFQVTLSRPYTYRYESFEKYLEGVVDGFEEPPPDGFADCLKQKLKTAWENIDQKTRIEMGIGRIEDGFTYHLVDLAATRKDINLI
jgi:ubiquinone/menaquinone biosynthesis C-methylase UbiE